MPVYRFRIRALMLAVALLAGILAIAAEIGRERKLASEYRRRALEHGLIESGSRGDVLRGPGGMYAQINIPHSADKTVYNASMREKYEGAARRPWLPVPPDPPEPK